MIVVDASIVVELLIRSRLGESLLHFADLQSETVWTVPHVLDLEVASALRNMTAGGRLDAHTTLLLLEDFALLPVRRHPHTEFLGRIWELRHNFNPYDAAYIALAEDTNATLYTLDRKLIKGHRAKVVVIPT